jgi:RNA polymerase sigma factor (sigma-70 family)
LPVVVGFLRGQGAVEPDDLASEVFFAVLGSLDTFTGDEQGFTAFVMTIARRGLADERRRLHRRLRTEALDTALEPPGPDDVERTVAETLSADQIRTLCRGLTRDQQNAMLLRFLGQLTVDEIAEALGKSRGAVKAPVDRFGTAHRSASSGTRRAGARYRNHAHTPSAPSVNRPSTPNIDQIVAEDET